mgnify:CR=1 FL=1
MEIGILDGLVDTRVLQDSVILPIIEISKMNKPIIQNDFINSIANNILTTASVKITKLYHDVLDAIIRGKTVIKQLALSLWYFQTLRIKGPM